MGRQLIDTLFTADTLSRRTDGIVSAGETIGGSVMSAVETVYGPASTLVAPDVTAQVFTANPGPLTGNIFYDLAVLACFLAFCLIVYFFRGYVLSMFGLFRGAATTDKMLGEQSKVFGSFLIWIISLGLLITGLTVMKFAEQLYGPYIAGLTGGRALAAILAAWGVAALVWGFQFVFLKTAGSLTLRQGFTARLFYLKKIIAAIATLTVLPVFLLFALSDGQSARILGTVVLVIGAMLMIFLIVRTFMLFVRHNFSILFWFLYLCVVEIFPVSLAVMMGLRLLGNH